MKYISLNNSSLTVFTAKGKLSELSGSSKYHVFDKEIVIKEKSPNGKIENKSCLLDILEGMLHDNMTDAVVKRILINYTSLWQQCLKEKFTSESKLDRLEQLESVLNKYVYGNSEFVVKYAIICERIKQENSRYQRVLPVKRSDRVINKSKSRNKMYALFNLKCSKKFVAFYSVSFPVGSSDDECFTCWNYWLTYLRKHFGLTNYIWVTERQKNGTLHYHMFTNNNMPILFVNRAMAKIIDNRVIAGLMDWCQSSLEKYNGVDVDSVYSSKRHKKTGKSFTGAQLREWLTKYITKYVTKNNEKFTRLCWHCSRSVSILFTSSINDFSAHRTITDFMPTISTVVDGVKYLNDKYYMRFFSEFNDTFVFLFVPPDNIFAFIRWCNDMIFVDFEPLRIKREFKVILKNTKL